MHTPHAEPEALQILLATKQISALSLRQVLDVQHHVFQHAGFYRRIEVAEIAFRFNRTHSAGLDLFLAAVLPLAERAARRRAERTGRFSEWKFEAMYGYTVAMAIELFQHGADIRGTEEDSFRRYLLRALKQATLRFFTRQEHTAIRTLSDLETRPFDKYRAGIPSRITRNRTEEQLITKLVLEQVLSFDQLPEGSKALLQCIAQLGPDYALKEHAFTASGDPDHWKRGRGTRPILDPEAIAHAMGTDRQTVHAYLAQARRILRRTFNGTGELFYW